LNKKCNIIWQKASNTSNYYKDNIVIADTLEDATKQVMISDDIKYAFRRNKEILDFKGKFKSFNYENKDYVIKIYNNCIPKEYLNAIKAREILKNNNTFYVPIPKLIKTNNNIGLVYPDYGYTLHEDINQTKLLGLDKIIFWFKELLTYGIEWAGFLPRNIIYKKNQLILIDWEDVTFNDCQYLSISDLTLFKFILGWSQVYGSIKQVKEFLNKNGITTYTALPDDFEITYGKLTNISNLKQIREKTTCISLISESPSSCTTNSNLSFMDIGHLIDDLFNINFSVLYTCCSSIIREKYGDLYFSIFAEAFEAVLCLTLRDNDNKSIVLPFEKIQQTIILFLLYFFQEPSIEKLKTIATFKKTVELNTFLEEEKNISSYILKFTSCKKPGLNNAITRSFYIHHFLYALFEIITKVFFENEIIFLLLRGSCAQGLMTNKSDVDFEVSNKKFPNGHNAIEHLISDVLAIFNIDSEGSWGRPQEADVFINGYSRDYHEWIELTVPNNIKYNKGWLANEKPQELLEQKWSIYEKKNKFISEKYIFFKIRALILRLVLKYNIPFSFYSDQISELTHYIDSSIVDEIKKVVVESLALYENSKTDIQKILQLNERIDNLYKLTNLKMYN